MIVRRFPNPGAVARACARDLVAALRADPALVLGLPTGRTPLPLYRELVRLYRLGAVDFSRAITFNLDEFVGISPRDPRSYHEFMHRWLFRHVNLRREHTNVPNGLAVDLDRERARYERAITRAGGIDVLLLGLGANGHIGFNEPASALEARTHRTRLSATTRRANAGLFGSVRAVPREGISMGMATILQARRIVLLATGALKARSVQRMIEGPVTPMVPASFLQLHAHAEVWLDEAAARRLSIRAGL